MFSPEDISRLKTEKVEPAENLSGLYDKDLGRHFEMMKNDFAGQSALAYETAKLIVSIRREINIEADFKAFYDIVKSESAFLSKELNIRWIVSIMDTLADYAEGEDGCAALMLSVIVNMMKLAETEKKYFYDKKQNPNPDNDGYLEPLFDGMTYFRLNTGDMPVNLFKRVSLRMGKYPYLFDYYREIMRRLTENDNMLSHLNGLHLNNFMRVSS